MEVPESEDDGELVEGPEFISFVLMAPGYCMKDFKVEVARRELWVEAPDFEVRRALGSPVDPSGAAVDYRNGVLSVRIPKKL